MGLNPLLDQMNRNKLKLKDTLSKCKMCKEYETQLKEALDKLISIQMANKLLQKELCSLTQQTTWSPNLNHNVNKGIQITNANNKWTSVTAKTRGDKLRKHGVSATLRTDHHTATSPENGISRKNRFSPLPNPEGNECAPLHRMTKPMKHQPTGKRIPSLVNGNLDYLNDFPSLTYKRKEIVRVNAECHQTKKILPQSRERSSKTKHKILIIGDSHARNCANLLQGNLSTEFKVASLVKPGANMSEITNTAREELNTLRNDDLIVVWGGANDTRKNNMREAVKLVSGFVDSNKNQNIVFINSPHRYDLSPWSCVNNEVAKFNRQVKKIMKLRTNMKILELPVDRNHFTSHGLYLNSKGKDVVSQNLALVVQQFFNKQTMPPIPISTPWEDPPLNVTSTEPQDKTATEEANVPTSSSYHRRNCPVLRNPHFYGCEGWISTEY